MSEIVTDASGARFEILPNGRWKPLDRDEPASEKADAEQRDALPFRTLAELIAHARDAAPDRWIVKHFLAPGAKTLLSSRPKVGKSTTGFGIVKALRTEQDFAGLETARNVGILYLTEETSVRALEVKAAAVDLDITDPGILFLRRVEMEGMPWSEVVGYLRKRAAAFKAKGGFDDVLVVIDTLGKWAGFEEGQEQDAGATRVAIERLDPLAGDGHAVLIFTHAGWSAKRSRGSSAIPGEVDVVLYLDGEPGSAQPRSILYEGGRLDDGETPRSWSLTLGDDGLTTFGEAGPRTAVKLSHVLDFVRKHGGPVTAVDLASGIGVTDRTARSYLNRLVASGELVREDRIGGAGGGQTTVYGLPDGISDRPDGKEDVQIPFRPLKPSDQGISEGPPPPKAGGNPIETPLSFLPGRAETGPNAPERVCLRCERYGPDHRDGHITSWEGSYAPPSRPHRSPEILEERRTRKLEEER